jgi:hypothetical protein
MKKLILPLICFVLLAFVSSTSGIVFVRAKKGGGASCTAYYTYDSGSDSGNDSIVGYDDGIFQFGTLRTDASARTLCQVDVAVDSVTGDPSGKDYVVLVYTTSGTSLNTLQGTSTTFAGTTGTKQVTFDPTVSLTASTEYAFVVRTSDDSHDTSNYIKMTINISASGDSDNHTRHWKQDETQYTARDDKMNIVLYSQ